QPLQYLPPPSSATSPCNIFHLDRRSSSQAVQALQPPKFAVGEQSPVPAREAAQLEGAECDAAEADDRVSQRSTIALDLAMATLGEREGEPRRAAPAANDAHGPWHSRPVIEHGTRAPARKIGRPYPPLDFDLVHAGDLVARMQQSVGERPVVGEEQEPL